MSTMNSPEFERIVAITCDFISNTLNSKAKEYSINDDRLHNFNQMAKVNGLPVEQVIWGMASKHLSVILDMVRGDQKPTPFLVDEKIGDMINYLVILKAHFINELNKPMPVQPRVDPRGEGVPW